MKKLKDFWEWLGISAEEYAEHGLDYFYHYNRMENDFPEFEKLKNYAFELVDKNSDLENELYDLLTVMAIDNESQSVRDYIEENSSDRQLDNIIKIGISHLQTEARAQLPVLLFRRKPNDYKKSLLTLANDTKTCVKRRAIFALNRLNKNTDNTFETKRLALFWMWLGKSSAKYGEEGVLQIHGKEECDFPFFEDLLEYAKMIVDYRLLSEKEITDLFVIMSIDNESESTLDYIEAHGTEEQIKKMIEIGINHIQYQGRWQLAELIYRRRPINYREALVLLAKDTNDVVSFRARNLLTLLENN